MCCRTVLRLGEYLCSATRTHTPRIGSPYTTQEWPILERFFDCSGVSKSFRRAGSPPQPYNLPQYDILDSSLGENKDSVEPHRIRIPTRPNTIHNVL